MQTIKSISLFFLLLCVFISPKAQENVHPQSETYVWPSDPLVKAKLEQWQDVKFGMIIHWGLYAVPGIVESWMLCSEDWINRPEKFTYDEFKKWYWGLNKDFNPVNFDPDQWARAGKAAGMKYLVFTTKHHDGFSMFDTKQSDFKITNGPFANNPRADVAKYVFEAFRNQGFMIGAYFSKPDWHTEYYWWPKYATADRNNNYDIRKFPTRWQQFKDFTHNQVGELMNNYGKMDILWLDGGWVRPRETVTAEVLSWGARIPEWSQDIDIAKMAADARRSQPGLLVVDRTVHGEYENYQTPEQRIPAEKLDHPWESCMTLGNGWGWITNEKYKSSTRIIHTLVEIVAKGGNLLLGIGPKADGTLSDTVVQRLEEIGQWMNVNGKAIYETRTTDHYRDGNIYFTKNKNSDTHYAIACLPEGQPLPATIQWTENIPVKGSKMILLQTGKPVKYTVAGNTVKVELPAALLKAGLSYPALAFSFTKSVPDASAPAPVLPLPSEAQMQWHEMEMNAFVHFTTNTFTDKEWGYGDEQPQIFNPTQLDANQWAGTLKNAGFKTLILTCKHHDGFCLWPSQYTEHSVKNSPYKNGKGDIVKEVSEACKRNGLKFGVYLSPWDRNHAEYGRPAYVEYYRNQLRELFTNYGPVFEMWFDGANGGDGYYGGARERRRINGATYYDWPTTLNMVRSLSPNVIFFSDAGPGVRWVGNERGVAGATNWNTIFADTLYAGKPNIEHLLNTGSPDGNKWIPAEVDVSIRPGWFYHAKEDSLVKTPEKLFEIYLTSVGRGSTLLLNVPPDRRGLFHENDIKALQGFRALLDREFKTNLAKSASVKASSFRKNNATYNTAKLNDGKKETYWAMDDGVTAGSFEIAMKRAQAVKYVLLQEYIRLGQRVKSFTVEAWQDGGWKEIASGTTIGYKRILPLNDVVTDKVRVSITDAKACPLISNVELY